MSLILPLPQPGTSPRILVKIMNPELLSLLERLRKIQALYDAPGTPGEQAAAAAAAERLRERVRDVTSASRPSATSEREIEFRVSLEDAWSRKLFLAIARHHRAAPFRYRGQRRTTVMVKVTETHFYNTIIPHFHAAEDVLREHFDKITAQVIKDCLHESDDEAVEKPQPKAISAGD
ncbi:MAG: hypothetical protein SGJ11_01130 [Phycisphaerae bacterium]|nr:hypothetical protein [Phycisphaerae bacterium]